jgi:hypothetical protein
MSKLSGSLRGLVRRLSTENPLTDDDGEGPQAGTDAARMDSLLNVDTTPADILRPNATAAEKARFRDVAAEVAAFTRHKLGAKSGSAIGNSFVDGISGILKYLCTDDGGKSFTIDELRTALSKFIATDRLFPDATLIRVELVDVRVRNSSLATNLTSMNELFGKEATSALESGEDAVGCFLRADSDSSRTISAAAKYYSEPLLESLVANGHAMLSEAELNPATFSAIVDHLVAQALPDAFCRLIAAAVTGIDRAVDRHAAQNNLPNDVVTGLRSELRKKGLINLVFLRNITRAFTLTKSGPPPNEVLDKRMRACGLKLQAAANAAPSKGSEFDGVVADASVKLDAFIERAVLRGFELQAVPPTA